MVRRQNIFYGVGLYTRTLKWFIQNRPVTLPNIQMHIAKGMHKGTRIGIWMLLGVSLVWNVLLAERLLDKRLEDKNENGRAFVNLSERESTPVRKHWDANADMVIRAGERENFAELTVRLRNAGFTDAEIGNVIWARIDEAYRAKVRELLRLDPFLTLDKRWQAQRDRIEELTELEKWRREAIEQISGGRSWQEMDFNASWSKLALLHLISAAGIVGSEPEVRRLNEIIVEGASEATLFNLHPLGVKTPENLAGMKELISSSQDELQTLLGKDRYDSFFEPFVRVQLEDVWSLEERFGRPLSEEETEQVLETLTPPNPLGIVFGFGPDLSGRNFPDESLPAIREIVGDEAFVSVLEQQMPSLDVPVETRLGLFEIQDAVRRNMEIFHEGNGGAPNLEDYRNAAARLLTAEQMEIYANSPRGEWLTVDAWEE